MKCLKFPDGRIFRFTEEDAAYILSQSKGEVKYSTKDAWKSQGGRYGMVSEPGFVSEADDRHKRKIGVL